MSEKQQITEAMGIHKEWMAAAKDMNLSELPEFLRHLTEDYQHDYGTVCHAIAAAAIAAAWAVDNSPQGGITGFQAGAVQWEMIRGWGVWDADHPLKMLDMSDMLYPQYRHKYTTISKKTWEWLQDEARKNLRDVEYAHPDVVAHWKRIVRGHVPFCYEVEEEETTDGE